MAMKPQSPKIKSLAEIVAIARRAKRAGKRIVTTNGAFDLLHVGHVHNLQKARAAGDILIVGINSDQSVRTHKDRTRPIIPARERAEVVAALHAVDYVFIFRTPNPIPWLEKIRPDVHAKGADRTHREMPEAAAVGKYGGKIARIPYLKNHSTTAIIEKIKRTT